MKFRRIRLRFWLALADAVEWRWPASMLWSWAIQRAAAVEDWGKPGAWSDDEGGPW